MPVAIVKTDILAPFFGNVFVSAQWKPMRTFSPEFGMGYMGNWNSMYTGRYSNQGVYLRLGCFTGHNLRKLTSKTFKKVYIKPELVAYWQEGVFRNNSRAFDPATGFLKDVMVDDKVTVNAVAFVVNLGKHIDMGKFTLDVSFGYGVCRQEVIHHKTPAEAFGLIRNQYLTFPGPIPLPSDEPIDITIQGGCRLGYKLY